MLEDGFPPATLHELRELLGSRLDAALPWLEVAAAFYEMVLPLALPADVRNEIKALVELLGETTNAIKKLSPDAVALCSHLNDPTVSGARVHIHQSLIQVAEACEQARVASRIACGKVDSPATVLATGVAGALAIAEVSLSKGRDGLFARVLAVVWHAADPDNAPEDTFRYVRAAVDIVLADHPGLRAHRGRPKRVMGKPRNR